MAKTTRPAPNIQLGAAASALSPSGFNPFLTAQQIKGLVKSREEFNKKFGIPATKTTGLGGGSDMPVRTVRADPSRREFLTGSKAPSITSGQAFQSSEAQKVRDFQAEQANLAFKRRADLAKEFMGGVGDVGAGGVTSGADLQGGEGGMSESERILIQSQQEAGEEDINRLQDVLSETGQLSSGANIKGTAQILGATRGAVARTSAGFAENRLTRRHQNLLEKRRQLTQLVASVLA